MSSPREAELALQAASFGPNGHDDDRYWRAEEAGFLLFRSRGDVRAAYAFHVETGRTFHTIAEGKSSRMIAGAITQAHHSDRAWLATALVREGWTISGAGRELRPPARKVPPTPAEPVGAPPRSVIPAPAVAVKRMVKTRVVEEHTCSAEADEWKLRTALATLGVEIPSSAEVAFKITESNGLEVSWIETTTTTKESGGS